MYANIYHQLYSKRIEKELEEQTMLILQWSILKIFTDEIVLQYLYLPQLNHIFGTLLTRKSEMIYLLILFVFCQLVEKA